VKIFAVAVAIAKDSGAGFIDYSWPKPGAKDPVR
jgi:hypothetical protein